MHNECPFYFRGVTFTMFLLQPAELDKKFNGLLEKKWTSVIRLQKKVSNYVSSYHVCIYLFVATEELLSVCIVFCR